MLYSELFCKKAELNSAKHKHQSKTTLSKHTVTYGHIYGEYLDRMNHETNDGRVRRTDKYCDAAVMCTGITNKKLGKQANELFNGK